MCQRQRAVRIASIEPLVGKPCPGRWVGNRAVSRGAKGCWDEEVCPADFTMLRARLESHGLVSFNPQKAKER